MLPRRKHNRSGREPAEDVKRQIVSACGEAGLVVSEAIMRLLSSHRVRWIVVSASLPDWPFTAAASAMIGVTAQVNVSGEIENIQVYCTATKDDPSCRVFDVPRMHGRDNVELSNLAEELRQTLEERAYVIRRIEHGDRPPFEFNSVTWGPANLPAFGERNRNF